MKWVQYVLGELAHSGASPRHSTLTTSDGHVPLSAFHLVTPHPRLTAMAIETDHQLVDLDLVHRHDVADLVYLPIRQTHKA